MLSMAASSRVWMFWRHWSLASRPLRPSASSSLSSSSDSRDRDGGGGGIDDTGGEERQHSECKWNLKCGTIKSVAPCETV